MVVTGCAGELSASSSVTPLGGTSTQTSVKLTFLEFLPCIKHRGKYWILLKPCEKSVIILKYPQCLLTSGRQLYTYCIILMEFFTSGIHLEPLKHHLLFIMSLHCKRT